MLNKNLFDNHITSDGILNTMGSLIVSMTHSYEQGDEGQKIDDIMYPWGRV